MKSIVRARQLSFSYKKTDGEPPTLRDFSLEVGRGELIAIQGPSGSGKSTLLYLLGGFLKPDSGEILVSGKDIFSLRGEELASFRNENIGFIFQQFHLLPKSNVLENILLPKFYPSETRSYNDKEARESAKSIAKKLGIEDRLNHRPRELSGGQQQRVAIARALLNNPELILADEPTGNLDSKTAAEIFDLLRGVVDSGKTVIVITHDNEIADKCDKIVRVRDGKIEAIEENRGVKKNNFKGVHEITSPSHRAISSSLFRAVLNTFPVALKNLSRNRLRSFLTMIGVTIGVASVLAMMTVGSFTKDRILASYETLGSNKVVLRGHRNWRLRATDVVDNQFSSFDWDKDITPFLKYFPEVERASPMLTERYDIHYAGKRISNEALIVGVSESYLKISGLKLLMGTDLNKYHIESKSRVCIIGFEIAKRLFSQVTPLGQLLNLSPSSTPPYSCRVIGVLKERASNKPREKPNLQVIMPHTFFASTNHRWYGLIRNILLTLSADSDIEGFTKASKRYFENKYGKSGRFYSSSDSILVAQINQFLTLFKILLAAISLVSLLVGGVGITNMMLASISEQLREVGIRKAHGATDLSIRLQYLIESICLCLIAGLIGLVIGFGASQGIVYLTSQFVSKIQFEWVINYSAILISLCSILTVGILSGLIPAVKAEKLQVIDALRSD